MNQDSDFCMQIFISIVHEIYNVFDTNSNLELRPAFLCISKAFNKVWRNGLLRSIKRMVNFMSGRYQCIVLNGQACSCADAKVSDLDEERVIRKNLTQENKPVRIFL